MMRRAAVLLGFLGLFLIAATYFPSDDLVIFRGGIRAPIQDKGGQVFNCRSYNAVGDEATDNQTAIERCFDAGNHCDDGSWCDADGDCTGIGTGYCALRRGYYYFPPGTYRFTDELTFAKVGSQDGAVIEGAGQHSTTLLFDPAPATTKWAFVLNDGTGTAGDVSRITFRNLTLQIADPASGAFKLTDSSISSINWVDFENVHIEGYSQSAGTGVQMSGQVGCNCHNQFRGLSLKILGIGIKFSGYANANHVQDSWCGLTGVCFDFSPMGTDTMGGHDNLIERTEIAGAVPNPGINLGTGAGRNVFLLVKSDGEMDALDIASNVGAGNVFIGSGIYNSTLTPDEMSLVSWIHSRMDPDTTYSQRYPITNYSDVLGDGETRVQLTGVSEYAGPGAFVVDSEHGSLSSASGGIGHVQNFFQYSEQIEINGTTPWFHAADATLTANDTSALAPDGAQTAERHEGLANSTSYLRQSVDSGAHPDGRTFTACLWVRARPGATAANTLYSMRISDSVGTIASGQWIPAGKWERHCITGTGTGDVNNTVSMYLAESLPGTIDVLLWGASLEEAEAPGVYVPTAATAMASPLWGAVAKSMQTLPSSAPPLACTAPVKGRIYTDSGLAVPCFCNGTNWVQMDDFSTVCS